MTSGMGGISWHGITSGEILSVCTLMKVPEEELDTVMQNVKFMGHVVSNEFNLRVEEARQNKADRRS